jgi:hypothetical protein
MREITRTYGDQSAVLAADFYDEARAAVAAPRTYRARLADPAPGAQVAAMTRFAVTPLWSRDPRYGDALDQLAGGSGRLIRQAGRDTIAMSAESDPAGARYIRSPQPDACPFCLMIATSIEANETFLSARSASQVVGRSGARRGSRDIGDSYHDNCRCEPVPIWSPDDVPDLNRQLRDKWDRVQQEAAESGELRRQTSNDALNAWRRAIEAERRSLLTTAT